MMTTERISSDFPFTSNYVDVLGSKMHYVDVGQGDPVVFLHGNPTSSYLWRNVIPHISGQARAIAPDLIGMGKSDRPDIPYRYDDQYRYLSAFMDELDLGDNITLVLHDWGSGLGFRWAHEHSDRIKAIAFMEAMTEPLSWDVMPAQARVAIRLMRAPGLGWLMASVGNMFIKKMLPDMVDREMEAEAKQYYASAFPTVASRKPVRQWPREIPISGSPAGNHATVAAFSAWLRETDVPKLLFYAQPGALITPEAAARLEGELSNLTSVDIGPGLHFIQEDNPDLIGSKLAEWYATL